MKNCEDRGGCYLPRLSSVFCLGNHGLSQQNIERGLMRKEEWKANFNRVRKTF